MKWVLDIDGTIDANPVFYAQLTYFLHKPGNDNEIYIVTCRNPSRRQITEEQLDDWDIDYNFIIFMEAGNLRDHKSLLEWKLATVKWIDPDIWIDDELKLYRQIYQIDLRKELPKCNLIQI